MSDKSHAQNTPELSIRESLKWEGVAEADKVARTVIDRLIADGFQLLPHAAGKVTWRCRYCGSTGRKVT